LSIVDGVAAGLMPPSLWKRRRSFPIAPSTEASYAQRMSVEQIMQTTNATRFAPFADGQSFSVDHPDSSTLVGSATC